MIFSAICSSFNVDSFLLFSVHLETNCFGEQNVGPINPNALGALMWEGREG